MLECSWKGGSGFCDNEDEDAVVVVVGFLVFGSSGFGIGMIGFRENARPRRGGELFSSAAGLGPVAVRDDDELDTAANHAALTECVVSASCCRRRFCGGREASLGGLPVLGDLISAAISFPFGDMGDMGNGLRGIGTDEPGNFRDMGRFGETSRLPFRMNDVEEMGLGNLLLGGPSRDAAIAWTEGGAAARGGLTRDSCLSAGKNEKSISGFVFGTELFRSGWLEVDADFLLFCLVRSDDASIPPSFEGISAIASGDALPCSFPIVEAASVIVVVAVASCLGLSFADPGNVKVRAMASGNNPDSGFDTVPECTTLLLLSSTGLAMGVGTILLTYWTGLC